MEERKKDELKDEVSRAPEDKKNKKPNGNKKNEKPSTGRGIAIGILTILTVVSGYFYYSFVVRKTPPKVIYQREEKAREIVRENIVIYIPDEGSEGLVEKQVEIVSGSTEEERIKNIFDVIKENLSYTIVYTDDNGKVVEVPFLKGEVQLLDVFADGSDLYLNMNYHFRDNMKTISQEIFVIYSIVNTLTEDSRYKRVKFLINNKEVEQLNFYNLSDFYERNLEI